MPCEVYYYRLQYTPPEKDGQLPDFSLADVHARAHFNLRLLNAADPRNRQLSASMQIEMGYIWEQFLGAAIDVQTEERDSRMANKRTFDQSIGLPESIPSLEVKRIGHVC